MVVLLMQEREADGVHRITVRLKMTHFKHYVQCTTYQYVLTTFSSTVHLYWAVENKQMSANCRTETFNFLTALLELF